MTEPWGTSLKASDRAPFYQFLERVAFDVSREIWPQKDTHRSFRELKVVKGTPSYTQGQRRGGSCGEADVYIHYKRGWLGLPRGG